MRRDILSLGTRKKGVRIRSGTTGYSNVIPPPAPGNPMFDNISFSIRSTRSLGTIKYSQGCNKVSSTEIFSIDEKSGSVSAFWPQSIGSVDMVFKARRYRSPRLLLQV